MDLLVIKIPQNFIYHGRAQQAFSTKRGWIEIPSLALISPLRGKASCIQIKHFLIKLRVNGFPMRPKPVIQTLLLKQN